jgi:hypothetical protein
MGLWMQDQTEVRFDKGGGKRFQNGPKKTSGAHLRLQLSRNLAN